MSRKSRFQCYLPQAAVKLRCTGKKVVSLILLHRKRHVLNTLMMRNIRESGMGHSDVFLICKTRKKGRRVGREM